MQQGCTGPNCIIIPEKKSRFQQKIQIGSGYPKQLTQVFFYLALEMSALIIIHS